MRIILIALVTTTGCVNTKLECTVKVPSEYGNEISPNGESNNVRYTKAYKAFWWQCIKDKSNNLTNSCKWTCSGNAAATSGCTNGAHDAMRQIDNLIKEKGIEYTQKYLKKSAKTKKCKENVVPYFGIIK